MKSGEIVREYYRQQGEFRERLRIRDRVMKRLCSDQLKIGNCEHTDCWSLRDVIKVIDNQ